MIKSWQITESELMLECRVFRVRKDASVNPRTGAAHDMFVIESADFVNIVPLTPQNEVVMVEQFRHGSREVSLETPGGLVEAPGESYFDCARRELLEETGYEAEELVALGEVLPNPAIQSNKMLYVLARNCRKVAEPQPDHAEDIAVRLVPLPDIPEMIRDGRIDHALIVTAFYFLNDHLASKS